MRIALFTDQGAHYRFPVFRAIDKSCPPGSDIDFYIPDTSEFGLSVPRGDVGLKRVIRIKNYWLFQKVLFQSHVISVVLSGKYDVVVLWGVISIFTTWLGAIFAKIFGIKVIMWGHGMYGSEGRAKSLLRKSLYNLADHNLLYGAHGESLVRELLPDAQTAVIYNSLDVAHIRKLIAEYENTPKGSEWDLIFVGRLTEIKRVDLLIQACALLKTEGCELKLLIVGDGIMLGELQKYAIAQGVDAYITWAGECYDEEVIARFFRMSKFCISPGNIGLMAMHALYNDTPVIIHSDMRYQMPEAEAILDGVNGFHFKYNSVRDLADTINRALSADYDSLSKACFPSTKNYCPSKQAEVFWESVSDLCVR